MHISEKLYIYGGDLGGDPGPQKLANAVYIYIYIYIYGGDLGGDPLRKPIYIYIYIRRRPRRRPPTRFHTSI